MECRRNLLFGWAHPSGMSFEYRRNLLSIPRILTVRDDCPIVKKPIHLKGSTNFIEESRQSLYIGGVNRDLK